MFYILDRGIWYNKIIERNRNTKGKRDSSIEELNLKCTIKIAIKLTDGITINVGIKQEYSLSAFLFNL